MGQGFPNPVVGGGGQLVIPLIKSPDFITGVSGWEVRADGSAEFNSLEIRGTFNGTDYIVNSSGIFFYNGPPAAGNLIMALVNASGTDSFGNPYSGPGISLTAPGGSAGTIQIRPDLRAMLVYAG